MKKVFLYVFFFVAGLVTSLFFVGDVYRDAVFKQNFAGRHTINLMLAGATEFHRDNKKLGNDIVTSIFRGQLALLESKQFLLELSPEEKTYWLRHKEKIEFYLKEYPASDCAHVVLDKILDCHLNSTRYNDS